MKDTDGPAASTAQRKAQPVNGPSPTDPSRVRVSTVVGDRLCVACGFNLTGQPVFKESVYNLFIVRCPECGAVASLQEYPMLGKWANRWAALAAALWFAVIGAGVFGLGVSFFASSAAGTAVAADSASRAIIMEWVGAPSGQGALEKVRKTSGDPNRILTGWSSMDTTWWDSQNGWAVLKRHGGWRKIVIGPVISILAGTLVAGVVGGVILSVAMLHVPRRRLTLSMLLPIAVAAAFQAIFYTNVTTSYAGAWGFTVRDAAAHLIAPATMTTTDAFAYIGLVIGAVIGRSVVRGLARAMLPPRMRSSLSFLWIAAGKEPPKATP